MPPVSESPKTTDSATTRRSVFVACLVSSVEALALGVAAWVSGSFALGAQTLADAADVGVEVFLHQAVSTVCIGSELRRVARAVDRERMSPGRRAVNDRHASRASPRPR